MQPSETILTHKKRGKDRCPAVRPSVCLSVRLSVKPTVTHYVHRYDSHMCHYDLAVSVKGIPKVFKSSSRHVKCFYIVCFLMVDVKTAIKSYNNI